LQRSLRTTPSAQEISMPRVRRSLLLAASAALALGVAGAAAAQVPEQPGFYAGATGLWRWNWGDRADPGAGLNARPRSGPGFSGVVGYKMDSPWDVALGGGAQWHRNASSTVGGARLDTSSRYQYVDVEAGYSMNMGNDTAIRVFGGVRGLHFNQDAVALAIGTQAHRNVWAVGPRVGIGGQTFFSQSVGLVGSVDGSLLAGSFSEVGTPNGSGNWRLVPVVGGEVGLQYRFPESPSLAITGGARIDALFNASFGSGMGGGSAVSVGPFMRVTYNLSGPGTRMPAPAPAPAPPSAGGRSYMVFFDFDRSIVTDTAATTIRQAANDAKAGRATRLNVTGHADRSGGDDYNMALSLRRANAVKDVLVREGIPAAQIAVVGRGESQPLVQTADGVREPQNRRVEIVF
jgi:outer membrane protein OmpA-like peptidoglycan-associated protein